MISFWEKDALLEYDYIVVGSGILGLSTAIEIKERKPEASIIILERGLLPTGASTKNAGFACFAKACEMLSDIKLQGEAKTAELAHERYEGLVKLRERVGDQAMDFRQLGGYELILDQDTEVKQESLDYLNSLLAPHFKQDVFEFKNELIDAFGFGRTKQLIHNPLEGQIHSGRLIDTLWTKAGHLGIKVITGAEVLEVMESANGTELEVFHASLGEYVLFKGQKVVLCTNALAKSVFGDETIEPGRGQVLVSEEIPSLRFQGTFHFDEGYYYFRNYGNRILFGGGRNLDKETENTGDFTFNWKIQEKLNSYLSEVILPNEKTDIAMRWTGIMGFSTSKTPFTKKLNSSLYQGFTCNGMGIALGSQTAAELADLVLNN
ncbi:MAG: FAD-binding oxidoreductase [Bacteroidetes bacterium]|nr:MAG: FAD-binding oxidoreductase [Bacteroidota bacterium]